MRVVIQRVLEASVIVAGETVGHIGPGMLVLAGFEAGDTQNDIDWMVRKLVGLRIFPDADGVMNLDLADSGGEILAVSQFTLFASVKKGNRPSWCRAASAEISRPLFQQFVAKLSAASGRPVQTGTFGADMKVSLINDGPVTLAIDSKSPE
ncbi:D-aminoacyl-tRNA deacylase [Sulfuricystis multivorans]|uniref:D-aminoacyl-tRNA deacylase n=1 Tax=Sulfuricystis multivorans TaxID=2211108 RepID=UPI000F84DD3C|nr:D-aminoacyl-tRNA deacylase [Sulfuricystis multivorans]